MNTPIKPGGEVSALEVALNAFAASAQRPKWSLLDCEKRAIKATIAAFLAAHKPEDDRVEEIQGRSIEDEQRQWLIAEPLMFLVQAMRDRATLLEIVTSLSVRNAAFAQKIGDLSTALDKQFGTPCEQIRHQYEIEDLKDQLTAHKAAHAMMRPDGKRDHFGSRLCIHNLEMDSGCNPCRRSIGKYNKDGMPVLADKIEGEQ